MKAVFIAPALRAVLADADGIMGTVEFQNKNTTGQINISAGKKDIETIYKQLEKEIKLYYQREGTFPKTVAVEDVGLFKIKPPCLKKTSARKSCTYYRCSAGIWQGNCRFNGKRGSLCYLCGYQW